LAGSKTVVSGANLVAPLPVGAEKIGVMTCMTAATAGQGNRRLGTWLRRRRAGVHAKETKTEDVSSSV
jgi:hypothetical protein